VPLAISNMRICSTIITLILCHSLTLMGQPRRNCATMEHHQQLIRKNPSIRTNQQKIESFTEMRAKLGRPRETIIRIPVVVHVLYNTQEQNISEEQIRSQIEVLNQDFQRKNADSELTDPLFKNTASAAGMEFVLANVDPAGNPTTGITRTYTDNTSFIAFTDEVKKASSGGKDPWPADSYLNIWVCNLGMGVLGFAQFPGGPLATDGVVIGYQYFGVNGTVSPPFNMGRTTTHEIGHWLNLRHIWGDTPCGDDGVEDTPPAEGPHHGCVMADSSCGSPDMVQNFMDYTDDACMNFFTKGQRKRMRVLFDPGGSRESLIYSKGYDPDKELVCNPPLALTASNISQKRATLNWDPLQRVSRYEVRGRRLPNGEWKTRTYNTTIGNVSQLWPCTTYEFEIRSICEFGESPFSESVIFKTQGCTEVVPSNIIASRVATTEALITWDAVSGADFYRIEYARKGAVQKEQTNVSTNSVKLVGLLPNQTYYFRVRANVENKLTAFSKSFSFTTQTSGREENPYTAFFELSPNPATDHVILRLNQDPQGRVSMTIQDDRQNIVSQKHNLKLYPQKDYRLSTRNMASGIYLFTITTHLGHKYHQEIELSTQLSTIPTARGGN